MENASKALIMAGSILIALLVIGLLVLGYNQLSDWKQVESASEENKTIVEYMRQFEQFNRTLYGSELLSLANLQEDYNKSDAREDIGYDRINITVQITDTQDDKYGYFVSGVHTIEEISEYRNKLELDISKYERPEKKYNNKSVKYYSQKRYREIAIDFKMNPPSTMLDYDIEYNYLRHNSKTIELLEDIQEYTNLNSIYTQFRTGKKFKCTNVEYDDYNGRIKAMQFVEI